MDKFKFIIPILLLGVLVLVGASCGEGGEGGGKQNKREIIKAVLQDYAGNFAGEGEMRLETEWDAVTWKLTDECECVNMTGQTYTCDRIRTAMTEIMIAGEGSSIWGIGLKEWNPEGGCVLFYSPDKTVIENKVNTFEIEGIEVCQNTLYYGLSGTTECNGECSFGPYHMVVIGSRFQFDGHEFLVETDKSSNPTQVCLSGEIPGQHREILETLIKRIKK